MARYREAFGNQPLRIVSTGEDYDAFVQTVLLAAQSPEAPATLAEAELRALALQVSSDAGFGFDLSGTVRDYVEIAGT